THRPWQFHYRPWELKKTDSIDVMDAVGSNIRVDARGPEVMRVLPRTNDAVNEEWLSDVSRYAVDGLQRQRLDRPYVRDNGKLRAASWEEALEVVAAKLKAAKPEKIGVIAGDLQDAESMKAALDLFRALGSPNTDCRQDGAALGHGPREGWLFNTGLQGIEKADAILIVGANPRTEAPLLNARLRKAWLTGKTTIGLIGEQAALTVEYSWLGAGSKTLAKLPKAAMEFLSKAERPAIIVGAGALVGETGPATLSALGALAKKVGVVKDGWNGFNVLHTAAARVGGLDMGFTPGEGGLSAVDMVKKGALDVLFLLGADEIDASASKAFKIYLGSHGDRGAHGADVILPGAAYTEKPGIYVNTEGRVQMAERAVFPKGQAKEDWAILRALSALVGQTLPYDRIDQLRAKLMADHPTFGRIDYLPAPAPFDVASLGKKGELGDVAFHSTVRDPYLNNPIARASVTMAELSALRTAPAAMAAE
ncbi:molybdopterin-dependent oxidoreductase, partial [Phenylobacterium sp.]|uniref:molybdopterin-dependent oxidoreductase n=1 Tax=Phenylobacterium sp. TaxID=1871053 RepID=UPI00281103E1